MKPKTQAELSKHTPFNLSNSFPYCITKRGRVYLYAQRINGLWWMHKLLLHSQPLIFGLHFYKAWMRKASLSFDPNWWQTVAGTDLRPRICEMTLNPVTLWTVFDLACWHSVPPKSDVTFNMTKYRLLCFSEITSLFTFPKETTTNKSLQSIREIGSSVTKVNFMSRLRINKLLELTHHFKSTVLRLEAIKNTSEAHLHKNWPWRDTGDNSGDCLRCRCLFVALLLIGGDEVDGIWCGLWAGWWGVLRKAETERNHMIHSVRTVKPQRLLIIIPCKERKAPQLGYLTRTRLMKQEWVQHISANDQYVALLRHRMH